jgi:hypothetical protein
MVRKLSFLFGLVFFMSLSAHAQGLGDKVEVFGGYSYLRTENSPSFSSNGWEISGQYKVADWLGAVADFDGHYYNGTSQDTFLFGPQVSWPGRVSPFAHVLLGAARDSAGGFSSSAFALGIGGGIDTQIAHGIYWRIIQGDYLPTHFGDFWQNNARVSTGIVFRF